LNAGKEAGYKYIEDINQYDNEGFGPCPQTISSGYRARTSYSFLNPIKDRKNLTIVTKSITNKLLFEGSKCIGLEYIQGKDIHKVYADREVFDVVVQLILLKFSNPW
jgi:choline dehydrogenase